VRCIIHIGVAKTATTTLQDILVQNRDILTENGIFYSIAGGKKNHIKITNYALNDRAISARRRRDGMNDSANLNRFREQLKKNVSRELTSLPPQVHSVIFSDEYLSRFTRKAELLRLKELFEPYFDQFSIIVYFRRQDTLLRSWYGTNIKTGSDSPRIFPNGDSKALRRSCERFNYKRIADLWCEVFGVENFIPKVFEKKRFAGGDIVKDFFESLSLDFPTIELSRKDLNTSFSAEAQEILRLMNVHLAGDPKKSGPIGRLFQECFPGVGKEPSRQSAIEFMHHFEESNHYIAETFFGREHLFNEDYNMWPEQETAVELTVPDVVEALAKVWSLREVEVRERTKALVQESDTQKRKAYAKTSRLEKNLATQNRRVEVYEKRFGFVLRPMRYLKRKLQRISAERKYSEEPQKKGSSHLKVGESS